MKRKSNKIDINGNKNRVVQNTVAQNIDLSEKVTDKNPNDEFSSLLVEQWIENGGDYNKI